MAHLEIKRTFVEWLLVNSHLKQPEVGHLLHYMLRHDDLLENVHFVDNTENCPRTLLFSEWAATGVAFQYKTADDRLLNPEQAIRNLRSDHRQPLYVHVILDDAESKLPYLNVLESNPFQDEPPVPLSPGDLEEIDALLDHLLTAHAVERLERDIDRALDEKDRSRFLALTAIYNTLVKREPQTT